MPTTTNNGWPTPADTDLVKNGADAIRDLGNAIDTTLGVYSPATPGLVKINTTSFSGVSSQSINDVFSATYTDYRILINFVASADNQLHLRLRVGGSDNSTASSYLTQEGVSSGAATAFNRTTADRLYLGNSRTIRRSLVLDLANPFETLQTTGSSVQVYFDGGNAAAGSYGYQHTQTVSYTGFTLIPASGTVTGSASVFGYNK